MEDGDWEPYRDPLVFDRMAAEGTKHCAEAIMAQDWQMQAFFNTFCVWVKEPSFHPHVIRGLGTLLRRRNEHGLPVIMTSQHEWPIWLDVFCDTEGYMQDNERQIAMTGREEYERRLKEIFYKLRMIHI